MWLQAPRLFAPIQRRFIGSFRHNICTGDWVAFPGDDRMRRPRAVSEMGKVRRCNNTWA